MEGFVFVKRISFMLFISLILIFPLSVVNHVILPKVTLSPLAVNYGTKTTVTTGIQSAYESTGHRLLTQDDDPTNSTCQDYGTIPYPPFLLSSTTWGGHYRSA
ncbi:MAG: hypothetical protein ABSA92_12290 [Candidatus Bathyarchaeia archaeon]